MHEDVVDQQALTEWRAAAWCVSEAWERWRATNGEDRHQAHALYLLALADEEVAANRLQRETALRHPC